MVSNADLLQTLEQLLGPDVLDPDYLASIRSLRPAYPCFLTHIGVQGISTDVLRKVHGYYWNEWDTDLMGRNGLKFKIFVPTLFEPRMAPPGGHVIVIQKVLDIDYEGIEDWSDHKMSVERYILDNLEEVIPGISNHIVVHTSASAQTSHRFTRNSYGAMLGWEVSPDQLGDRRPDTVGPLKQLYFTGHWVQPGGGITPVIASAMQVAEAIAGGTA